MRILSGIKPSGEIHFGNYLGMLKPMIQSQGRGELLCFIANLHSLTSVNDADRIAGWTRQMAIDILALGLDPESSVFWIQSDVPEVCEYAWYLSNYTPVGMLERCHAYKDKVANGISANHGLFAYPVLMAADILAYEVDRVPVGQDQKQHLEVARDLVDAFNHRFGEILVKPEPEIREDVAVVQGLDGQKMSKSYGNTLGIFADAAEVKKKIMAIPTDSTPLEEPKDPDANPIHAWYSQVASPEAARELADRLRAGGYGWGHAKKELVAAYIAHFEPYRKRREEIASDLAGVRRILDRGAERARAILRPNLERVRAATGIRWEI
ncbi:MAG: tryptophan--tRNA ligase [Fibrobacteria bacterium]|nr:tryptophan--tRNA ligase [Fibrobacteria bacterium]